MIAAPLAAQPRTLASEALVAALGLVHEAGAALVTVPGSGRVHQISTSGGGVPKRAVANAEIGWRGVVGDRQDSRQFHGRPWQALCLWSLEVIEAFAADGHPIFPGAAGENITIAGIDWATVHPGTQVQIGEVVAEISMWAEPCRQNAAWFRDGEFRLMHADRGPVSRAYATVLRPGSVFRDAVVGVLD
jgi:MOSC domain-containing protein YiiM